ncbi:hypothetical protein ACFRJ1_16935 [Streptomyces sp. NPDC056773]|uniref:hypothetical protein n=1 Tax=unclassified Streptomyces TaxID=2593676 RepID=UPI0020B7723E|nr:hypothetical protein [Streptomyces sp. TBY4]MCP3755745.1 hypothetical protein [Streptomyces sp. TBY4]
MMHDQGAVSMCEAEPIRRAEVLYLPGVALHVAEDQSDCHITVSPNHAPDHLRRILKVAEQRGLGLLDQDECEPTLLADDSVRLYLQTAA